MNILHIKEIASAGIEKEKRRRDFYARVAEYFEEKPVRELFMQLRDWEEAHIKRFSQIRDQIGEDDAAESYPGELRAYLDSLVDERLYRDVLPAEFAGKIKSVFDALRYAVLFEKDAVLFFSELERLTLDTQKEVIRQLIEEEKQHIVYLAKLRRKLGAEEKDHDH